MCQSSSVPVSDSTAISPTAAPRTTSAASSTRRRSKRSVTTPPISSSTIVGTVIAIPTIESAVGAFESAYTCHAIATRNTPSPISEPVCPPHRSAKSRWRRGATRFTRVKPPGRSSES